jgi:hypothetical protein
MHLTLGLYRKQSKRSQSTAMSKPVAAPQLQGKGRELCYCAYIYRNVENRRGRVTCKESCMPALRACRIVCIK